MLIKKLFRTLWKYKAQFISMVLLEQIRTIDKQRIERYLGRVTRKEMFGINRALLVSLDLNTSSRQ